MLGAANILHADLDAFFASVEQRDDPRLRGRPVIVGGGVVLAASYEAKARGIRTAMGGGRARMLCPDAIVVPPRMSAYSEASKAVYRVFEDMAPVVEGLSIDEAFLDVRGLEHITGTPREIAVRLKREVLERVGLPITVGVARTKFLAKVASGVAKPDGLLVVPPDGELAFLHPLPVERLWGVGRVTAAKLHVPASPPSARWRTDEADLVSMLGPGRRPPPARPRPQPRPAAGCGRAAGAARSAPSAHWDAGRRRGSGSRPPWRRWWSGSPAECGRRGGPGARWFCACASTTSPGSRDRTRCPIRPPRRQAILLAARTLLSIARPMIERRGLTLVGVAVTNLDDGSALQLELPFDRRSRDALDAALDQVRDRYGSAAVIRAASLGRDQRSPPPLLPD